MIAYVLEGANPLTAKDDPRAARLMSAGPWMAQSHPAGAILTWQTPNNVPINLRDLSAGRKTIDGSMTYHGPKVLPALETLMAPNMRRRDDATDVVIVREEQLTKVRIVPAYASPRRILDDNTVGDFSTRYGKATRVLFDRVNEDRGLPYSAYRDELFEVCRLAIMHVYPRMTRELITDFDILDEDTVFQMWEGMIYVPKELSARVSASSDSQSTPAN